MKIGMIGTGGTGKTTTVKLLENKLPEKFIPSVPRTVFKRLGLTEMDQRQMSPQERWHIQKMIFDEKIKQDYEHPNGIFDRTLLDHLAYCLFRCDECIPENTLKSMMILVKENMHKYDQLFYFPLHEWQVQDDGFRENRFATRFTVAQILKGLISELDLKPYKVPNGDASSRARLVLSVIESKRRLLELDAGIASLT